MNLTLGEFILIRRRRRGWSRSKLAKKAGIPSKPVLVCTGEFGFKPALAVATCWISTETPLFPKWYLDKEFYHFDSQQQIAETVVAWMPLPDLFEATR